MFNNKKQLLCSNNFSLEIKKKLIKSSIWSAALYRSETWIVGKNEERFVNVFETRCWRRMLTLRLLMSYIYIYIYIYMTIEELLE